MRLRSFLKLVEIQTKVASITPFLLGSLFAFYRYGRFNLLNFIFMLVSLLSFDMTTTAINNYIDYKKARKTSGYNYEKHNAIVRDNLKESQVLTVIGTLLTIAIVFGVLLYLRTSPVVLVLGMISFAVGIFYTFGPIPISRMPLGEIFSGGFMGFVIIFISVFIHTVDLGIMTLEVAGASLNMTLDLIETGVLFLVALPATTGIANIMLANNICDIEDDIINKRYTLPIYIGREKSLVLFKALYYIAFVDIAVLLILGVLPVVAVLALLTLVPVQQNINKFMALQTKKDTFVNAIKNFLIMNVSLIILVGIGTLLKYLL